MSGDLDGRQERNVCAIQPRLWMLLSKSKSNGVGAPKLGIAAIGCCEDMQPSQIAIRSSGLSSHSMLLADGIQLGSLRIFAMFSTAVPTFCSFLGE
jgi:hypothetical protein